MHPDTGTFFNVHRNAIKDFMIAGPEYHGVKGLTLLMGIESPG